MVKGLLAGGSGVVTTEYEYLGSANYVARNNDRSPVMGAQYDFNIMFDYEMRGTFVLASANIVTRFTAICSGMRLHRWRSPVFNVCCWNARCGCVYFYQPTDTFHCNSLGNEIDCQRRRRQCCQRQLSPVSQRLVRDLGQADMARRQRPRAR